jgi:hypothetical protein
VFIEFLEISIVNAWIIMKGYLPYVTLKKFKIALIHSMLEDYRQTREADKRKYKEKYEKQGFS